jgi:hypothetical protein
MVPSGALTMARGWGNIARKAAGPAGYWLVLGLITFLGMTAVIKIEGTGTRLFLVVIVFGVAFGAASLLEQLLRDYLSTTYRRTVNRLTFGRDGICSLTSR